MGSGCTCCSNVAENSSLIPGESPRGDQLRKSLQLVTVAWLFGAVWFATIGGAPTTQFAKAMGTTEFQFGLLSAAPFLATLISLPASIWIERTGQRKKIFFIGNYIQRVLWIPISLLPFWLIHSYGPSAAKYATWIFLLLMFCMHGVGNLSGPAWVSWMADIVPGSLRGRYFSRRRMWGILTAVPATVLAGYLLDKLTGGPGASPLVMMQWCAVIFLAATMFGVADIVLFHPVPEPHAPPKNDSLKAHFSGPLQDRRFLWFGGYVATLMFAIAPMGTFCTLFVIERLKISNSAIQFMLLACPMLAQLCVLPAWGKAVDRMGKKPVMTIASLGLVPVGLAWCFVTRENAWLGAVLAAAGAALWAGVEIANFNFVLEMTADDDAKGGTSFVAINSVIINSAGFFGGLLWGCIAKWLTDLHHPFSLGPMKQITYFEVLFILSAVLRLLAAVVFLPKLHEPDARGTREALLFMGANIYNNLFSLIFLPLRYLNLRRRETIAADEER